MTAHTQYTTVPLDDLQPHPENVRSSLGDLRSLTKSIAAQGILETLIVRWVDGDGRQPEDRKTEYGAVEGDHLQIVAGHRRHAAALEADGIDEAPVLIRQEMSDDEAITLMLVENLQREDIDPLDEARGYFRLVERGWTQKRLAEEVGVSSRTVRERLKLLDLPDGWVKAHLAGELSQADLSKLDDLRGNPFFDPSTDPDEFTSPARLKAELEARYLRNEVEILEQQVKEMDDAELVRMEQRNYRTSLPKNHRFLPHPEYSSYGDDVLQLDVDDVREQGALGYVVRTIYNEDRVRVAYLHPVCTDAKVFTRKSSKIEDELRPEGWHKEQEEKARRRAEREARKEARVTLERRTAEAVVAANKSDLEDIVLDRAINALTVSESKAAAELLGVAKYRPEDDRFEPGKFNPMETEAGVLSSSRVKRLRFLAAAFILAEGIHTSDDVAELLDEYAPAAESDEE